MIVMKKLLLLIGLVVFITPIVVSAESLKEFEKKNCIYWKGERAIINEDGSFECKEKKIIMNIPDDMRSSSGSSDGGYFNNKARRSRVSVGLIDFSECESRKDERSKIKCKNHKINHARVLLEQAEHNDQGGAWDAESRRSQQQAQAQNTDGYYKEQSNGQYVWVDTRSGYEKFTDKFCVGCNPTEVYMINRSTKKYFQGAPLTGWDKFVLRGGNTSKVIKFYK